MIIRRETLKAALCAVSGDDSRYFLQAVCVRSDGAVDATDGHILARVRDCYPSKDEDFPQVAGVGSPFAPPDMKGLILPEATVQKLIGAMPKKSPIDILKCARVGYVDGHAYAVATDLSVPLVACVDEAQQQRFPKVETMLEDARKWDAAQTVSVCLDGALLAVLAKMAKETGGTGKRGVTLTMQIPAPTVEGGERPAVCNALRYTITGTEATVEGLIMPMRE